MKAAAGAGVVSSIVMESDALDEVDWVRHDAFYIIDGKTLR